MSDNSPATIVEKPLNQTQLKNLKELVEGDFTDLSSEVLGEIDQRLSRRLEEIAEKHNKSDDLEKARAKLVKATRDAEDKLTKLVAEITTGGIKVNNDRYSSLFTVESNPEMLVHKGREQEEKQAKNAASRLKGRANRLLGRQERQVQRQVLLQGISAQSAWELINDLPARDDMMALLAKELESGSGDDMKILMTKEEIEQARAIEKKS